MHPDIKRLVELQAVDMRLAELRGRLNAYPQQLAEIEKRVAGARQQLASAKEALTTSLKDRKKFELDVEVWKEKARKYREQSFEIKTNEAYKALQHEIQHAEGEVAQAEDRLLERMVAGEEFERQVKAAERAIVDVERAAETDQQKIQAAQASLRKELEAKESERQQLIPGIAEDLFQDYERIAQRRHGIALAEVRDEACSLCGVRVRPHVFQELRRDDCHEIFQCETCTRIFYYFEPAPAATAPTEAKPRAAGVPASEG
jgi:uncharacterized protein